MRLLLLFLFIPINSFSKELVFKREFLNEHKLKMWARSKGFSGAEVDCVGKGKDKTCKLTYDDSVTADPLTALSGYKYVDEEAIKRTKRAEFLRLLRKLKGNPSSLTETEKGIYMRYLGENSVI